LVLVLAACEDRRADKAYLRNDYDKTAKELEGLANLGEPRAQYDLALLYDKGLGVAQSDAEALRWYTRAAEQGEARAQYNLGLMYMNGQGTTPNLVMAYYWISLSVAQGNQNAPAARDYLAEKMIAEQIEEANRLVRAKLAEGGSP
jgi:TPR repeat protein